MSAESALSTHDELRRLVAEFSDSASCDEDTRIMSEVRTLAMHDPDGFVDALLDLDTVFERSDALESLVYLEPFEPRFEPIVEAYADALDDLLAANPEPASLPAYHAALGYCVLGELTIDRAPAALVDRLADRALRLLAHRHPDVRVVAVGLLVDFRRPDRLGCSDPIVDAFRNDPDPVVRDKAFTELESIGALPVGAARPTKPTWFRALRRYVAGG